MQGTPRRGQRRLGVLLLAGSLAAAGCSAEAGDGVGGDGGAAEGAVPQGEVVQVWFQRGEEPVAVERRVPGAPLTAAFRGLMAGPTEEEQAAGVQSWFGDSTRNALRRIQLRDGFLVVDFDGRLTSAIPNASSSAGSAALLASLDSTAFQFPAVDSVQYRLEGSCDGFWEWLQRGCTTVRRGSGGSGAGGGDGGGS